MNLINTGAFCVVAFQPMPLGTLSRASILTAQTGQINMT
jgi:hypothetical protein